MNKTPQNNQKSDSGVLRIFALIIESIGWLQIALSPILIGLFFGAIVYFSGPSTVRLIIAVVIVTVGLVIGVIWATKVWRRKGTSWFMSRIIATPELDKENDTSEKRSNNE